MINYEELEDAALFGIEESLDYVLAESESGWLPDKTDEGDYINYCGEPIAEAIYAKYMGWTE